MKQEDKMKAVRDAANEYAGGAGGAGGVEFGAIYTGFIEGATSQASKEYWLEDINPVTDVLSRVCAGIAVLKWPDRVIEYHSGKTGLVGMFIGEGMIASRGHANPKLLNKYVIEALNEFKNKK